MKEYVIEIGIFRPRYFSGTIRYALGDIVFDNRWTDDIKKATVLTVEEANVIIFACDRYISWYKNGFARAREIK